MVEYVCECCNYTTNKKSNINNHDKGKKHLDTVGGLSNETNSTATTVSNESCMTVKKKVEHICECCNYTTNKKSTYVSHNISQKHLTKVKEMELEIEKNVSINQKYSVNKKIYVTKKNKQKELNATDGFIYLLREREFIKTNEHIYKIGKSKQEFGKRFSQYPSQSQMYLHLYVNDVDTYEKAMIELFSIEFTKRIDIGYEYFEGNIHTMINLVFNCYFNDNFNKINEINVELQNKINDFISTKEKEKTSDIEKINFMLEKQKLKEEKQKLKEEKLMEDKAKLEQSKKAKIQKQNFQKTQEEKNKQEKIKRKLVDELKDKLSSFIVNTHFKRLYWTLYNKITKLSKQSLKEINSVVNTEIKKEITNLHTIYDSETIDKINIKYEKKVLMLNMCSEVFFGNVPNLTIRQIREQYYNKEDVIKMSKMDIIYYEMGELKDEFI